jgi:hypothetical protein
MIPSPIDESQRTAAKVVGICYLLTNALGIFAVAYVRGHLIAVDDAAQTATNIVAHETLFRLGIAGYLGCMLTDAALLTALYVILRRADQNLALFAACLRLVEVVIGVVATLNSFDVLRLLSGAGYLRAFRPDQLQALARIPISAFDAGVNVSFVFLGLGSAVFGYLWLKSNYVPRALAALGLFGSLLFAAGSFTIIVFPKVADWAEPAYFAPMGIFELTMGFWLLIKGLRPPAIVEAT